MSWRIIAERFDTADFSGSPVHSARAVFTYDTALKAVRTWVVFFNTPSFSSLEMRIYSNASNATSQLLHTFTKTWTLAEITDQPYAVQEIYFDTTYAFPLIGGETYHFVLWANGYTGNSTTHIGWVKAVADSIYSGWTPDMVGLGVAPYKIAYIGAKV